MAAGKWNFSINQGDSFLYDLQLRDLDGSLVNLAGFTCEIECETYKGSGVTLFTWTTGSEITVTEALGLISIDVEEAITAAYAFSSGYHKVRLTDGTDVIRLLEGTVTLDKE